MAAGGVRRRTNNIQKRMAAVRGRGIWRKSKSALYAAGNSFIETGNIVVLSVQRKDISRIKRDGIRKDGLREG